jgi:hypothetical protein
MSSQQTPISADADWIKVKCLSWREANKDRHELFNRERRPRR